MPCLEPGPTDRPVPGSRTGLPASPPTVGLTLALGPSCSSAPDSEALKVQRKKTSKRQNPACSSCPHLPTSSLCRLLPLRDQVTKTNPAPAMRRLLHPFTQGSVPCRSRLLKTIKAAAFTEPGQPASSSTWAGGDSPARQAAGMTHSLLVGACAQGPLTCGVARLSQAAAWASRSAIPVGGGGL